MFKKLITKISEKATKNDLNTITEKLDAFESIAAKYRASSNKNEKSELRNGLKELLDELFDYEAKYIQHIHERLDIECDTLVASVGITERPIILSATILRPRKSLILLHTSGSEEYMRRISNHAEIRALKCKIIPIEISEDDLSLNFEILSEKVFKDMSELGKICIDPTGGRKMMGTSLTMFAMEKNLAVVYVTDEWFSDTRLNFPFSSKLKVMNNPLIHYGTRYTVLLQKLWSDNDFQAVSDVCDSLTNNITGVQHDATWEKFEALGGYARLYQQWDEFIHSSSDKKKADLHSILYKINRRNQHLGIIDAKQVENNLEFLAQLHEKWSSKSIVLDEYRLIDTYANMLRRAKSGCYTDAMARAYALIERCAAYLLIERYHLGSTSDPRWKDPMKNQGEEAFPFTYDDVRRKFEAEQRELSKMSIPLMNTDCQFPHRNIALQNSCFLLKLCGHKKLWDIYIYKIREDLSSNRNNSIIGHGTKPITKEMYDSCEKIVKEFMVAVFEKEKEMNKILKMATFPEIKI